MNTEESYRQASMQINKLNGLTDRHKKKENDVVLCPI